MVVTRSATNRIKTSRKEEERFSNDFISRIPDDILQTILEKLPVKYSVRTSLLAHRWENVWKSMSSICINDSVEKDEDKNAAKFMKSFIKHNKVEKLKCFSVSLKYKSERILSACKKWMEFAISKKVERLDVMLGICEYNWANKPYPTLSLPEDLFNSSSLIQLTLTFAYLDPLPSFHLQTLRKLLLDRCQLADDGIEIITGNCPLLEHLVLSKCNRFINLKITVAAHSKLSAIFIDDRDRDHLVNVESPETSINAPNITALVINGDTNMRTYSLDNVTNIVEGMFKFVHDRAVYLVDGDGQGEDFRRMNLAKILEKFVRAKALHLCSRCILAAEQMWERDLKFKLTYLVLETHLDLTEFTGIMVLLRDCRKLQHLVVDIKIPPYVRINNNVDDERIVDMELHPLKRLKYVEFKNLDAKYQTWDEGKFQMRKFFADCVNGNELVKILKPPYAAVEKIVFTTRLQQFVTTTVPEWSKGAHNVSNLFLY